MTRPRRLVRRLFTAGIVLLSAASLFREGSAQARSVVYVIPLEGMIDLGLAPFVQRVIREAERDSAAAIILDINTFGGRLDAAVVIRDAVLSTHLPTIAFINRRAISAGALIAMAAQRVAITDGGTIGAATPVQAGQPGAAPTPVDEKSVSYVRKEFRSTAEIRKRPPLVAEAMVDADVEIPNVIEKGKLLTLTTEEAIRLRIADFRAANLDSVLATSGLRGAELRRTAPNWAEGLVRLITHPILSSLLLTVAMIGIVVEIRTPGFGVPGTLGIASLALLLGGHWIVQLAGWEELMLVLAGMVLLALEVLVLPGFGVAGIAGFVAILAGITLSFLGAGAQIAAVSSAIVRVLFSMVLAAVGSLVLLRMLPKLPFGSQLVLDTELDVGEGYASAPQRDQHLLGQTGRALSFLRPAGFAEINGERVDVVTDGDVIESGEEIVVTRVDGNRIVVRRHRATPEMK